MHREAEDAGSRRGGGWGWVGGVQKCLLPALARH